MKKLFCLSLILMLFICLFVGCSASADDEYDELIELYLGETERVVWAADITDVTHVGISDQITYELNGKTATYTTDSRTWNTNSNWSKLCIYTKETSKLVYIQDVATNKTYYIIFIEPCILDNCKCNTNICWDYPAIP